MAEAMVFWLQDPEPAKWHGRSPFVRQAAYSIAQDRIRALEAALGNMAGTYYYHPRLLDKCNEILRGVGLPDFVKPTVPETIAEPVRSDPDFAGWNGPWCKKCGAPIVTIPGYAPGCISNCPMPAETACTCDSTLVTDTSNHQPHCQRYVAETKAEPRLICSACGADRYKQPCGGSPLNCPMHGETQMNRGTVK